MPWNASVFPFNTNIAEHMNAQSLRLQKADEMKKLLEEREEMLKRYEEENMINEVKLMDLMFGTKKP